MCTWCGHPPHGHPCPRTIISSEAKHLRGGKTVTNEGPCPCKKHAPASHIDEAHREHRSPA